MSEKERVNDVDNSAAQINFEEAGLNPTTLDKNPESNIDESIPVIHSRDLHGISLSRETEEEEEDDDDDKAEFVDPNEPPSTDDVPNGGVKVPESKDADIDKTPLSIDDNSVLEFLNKRSGKTFSSLEEALTPEKVEVTEELDEEVKLFQEYKKSTGRGLKDYMNLNRDLNTVSDDELIYSHYKEKYPYASDEELNQMITFETGIDEDEMSDREILQRKLATKQIVSEGREKLRSEQEKYKTPLESRDGFVPEEERQSYQEYLQNKQESSKYEEEGNARREVFTQKSEELFNEGFEGFKYKVGEGKELLYKVSDIAKTKNDQMDISNFYGRFLDENMRLKDANEFHRSIAIATNPDKYAQFFYEQGIADATKEQDMVDKNINMNRAPQAPLNNKKPMFTLVNDSQQTEFKMKKQTS